MTESSFSRRSFLHGLGAAGGVLAINNLMPNYTLGAAGDLTKPNSAELMGKEINLSIGEMPFSVGKKTGTAFTINNSLPAPLIRLKEGQEITLNVTNTMKRVSSIHWHGILLPFEMDGVPGLSFAGIKPNETFEYSFPVIQSGTYWYHSHSGLQEQQGMYGPLIIDPKEPDSFEYDRDYVVQLSDWTFENPMKVLGKLKKDSGYYNFQKPTLKALFKEAKKNGLSKTLAERLMWERMRMEQTDFADVSGYTYTYLMNGNSPDNNWTAIFKPGEKVRLRFINSGAMSFFDIRIPGLKMTVVQADGQNVEPVPIDEFRMSPAETYDVIVEPKEDKAFTIFAESLDRSGFASGTLAPQKGMSAPVPQRRSIPKRSMRDMGMNHDGMNHGKMDNMKTGSGKIDHSKMDKMNSSTKTDKMPMKMSKFKNESPIPHTNPVPHAKDQHGAGNSAVAMMSQSRLHEAGSGLENNGRRVLRYTDLKSITPFPEARNPEREIELHLTGSMERYMWSFDGKKFTEVKGPIGFKYGETLRLTFVNDTMMEHPLHLHGMWMYLENGKGDFLPRKHTIIVKPAERMSVIVYADAPGRWAFHCHLLMHMDMGMFRVVEVSDQVKGVE